MSIWANNVREEFGPDREAGRSAHHTHYSSKWSGEGRGRLQLKEEAWGRNSDLMWQGGEEVRLVESGLWSRTSCGGQDSTVGGLCLCQGDIKRLALGQSEASAVLSAK